MNMLTDLKNEDWNKRGVIYCYTNLLNNKKYVGQTIRTLKQRHSEHISDSYKNTTKKYNLPIHCAIRKYGIENFSLELLITDCVDYDSLNKYERYFINKFKTNDRSLGYNIADGGKNGNSTFGKTEEEIKEWRRKINEHRDIKSEKNPMYGKHHTEETKEKIKNSEYHKNIKRVEIVKVDKENNITIYNSTHDAERDGYDRRHIRDCCISNLIGEDEFVKKYNKKCRSHKKCKWYFLNDYINKFGEL